MLTEGGLVGKGVGEGPHNSKEAVELRVKCFVNFGITGVPSGHSHRPVSEFFIEGDIQVLLSSVALHILGHLSSDLVIFS